jgi:hypothetical protein
MRAEIWEPIDGILGPCVQISFSYAPSHVATVLMTFEGTAGGAPRGLTLKFTRVVVLCGEEECPGGFAPIPKPLPQLGRGDHPTFTFPLLKLVDSEPLKQYELIFHNKGQPLAHFCLISLHNIVQVIASADAEVIWTPLRGQ